MRVLTLVSGSKINCKKIKNKFKKKKKKKKEIWKLNRTRLPCLRNVEKGKLFTEVRKMNELLKKIESKDVLKKKKRYKLKKKGKRKVKEEILPRIRVKLAKIIGYQERVSQFQQHRFFRNDEVWFYKQIDGGEEREEMVVPNAQEAKTFWTDILSQEVEHNNDATWLREFKKNINGKNRLVQVQILQEKLKNILKKISNWKARGPDVVQKFWLKNF